MYALIEHGDCKSHVHKPRLDDGVTAAIACTHASVVGVKSGSSPLVEKDGSPLIAGLRVFLSEEAHQPTDPATRDYVLIDEGFSGSASDVLTYLRSLKTKLKIGEKGAPAFVALVVDGQLYRIVLRLQDEHTDELEFIVPVLGPTHLHWALVGGTVKRWIALVLAPAMRAMGFDKQSDYASLFRNKNHRLTAIVINAAVDALLRALMLKYLESGAGGRAPAQSLLDPAVTHSHPITPAMRTLAADVLAWADRAGASDPTIRLLASFALDEGLLVVLNYFSVRNQLSDLFVSTAVALYPLLHGTAQTTYQELGATWVLQRARMAAEAKMVADLAMFESGTGNPFESQGTDGAQEVDIGDVKGVQQVSGSRDLVLERSGAEITQRAMHAQAMRDAQASLRRSASSSASVKASQFARDQQRYVVSLKEATDKALALFQLKNAFSDHSETHLVDVFGRVGEDAIIVNGALYIKSYSSMRLEGEAAAALYFSQRALGQHVKLTQHILPLLICKEAAAAAAKGAKKKSAKPVKNDAHEYEQRAPSPARNRGLC